MGGKDSVNLGGDPQGAGEGLKDSREGGTRRGVLKKGGRISLGGKTSFVRVLRKKRIIEAFSGARKKERGGKRDRPNRLWHWGRLFKKASKRKRGSQQTC